jgi:hypothetical protein
MTTEATRETPAGPAAGPGGPADVAADPGRTDGLFPALEALPKRARMARRRPPGRRAGTPRPPWRARRSAPGREGDPDGVPAPAGPGYLGPGRWSRLAPPAGPGA